jgi:hypothetical protein
MISAYDTTTGESEWRKSLDTPRHRWKDNIKIDLKIIAYEGMPGATKD